MRYYKFFRHGQPAPDSRPGTPGDWTWVLADVDKDVPALRKKFKNCDIYVTVQTYDETQVTVVTNDDSVTRYELPGGRKDCPYVAPLYFDLDSQDPELSRIDCKKVIDYLVNDLQVPEKTIDIYFSGKKGFHVVIDHRWMGMTPRTDWHAVMKLMTCDIARHLDLVSWDHNVYSARRMLRLEGSQHATTGLYKTPLTRPELDLSIEVIRKMAAEPREFGKDQPKKSEEFKLLNLIMESYVRHHLADDAMSNLSAPCEISELVQKHPTPSCIVDLLERGIWKEGDRNIATMSLAAYYKTASRPIDQAMADILRWSKMISPKLTSTHGTRLTVNTKSVVETVYKDPQYTFKCPFILSLGDKSDRVKCTGRMCPLNETNIHKSQVAMEIPLNEAYVASMVGKKVRTHAIISVAPGQPFIIPYRVRMTCNSMADCKIKNCLLSNGQQVERCLDASEHDVLRLCHKTEGQEKGILGSYLGCAGCKKFKVEVVEYRNVFDVTVATAIDYRKVAVEADALKSLKKEKPFNMTVYLIGENLPELNKKYLIEGYILPHPHTNRSVLVSETFESEATVLDDFKLTPTIIRSFDVLRPPTMTVENIKAKFDEIAEDIAEKSFQYHCRNEVMQAILLLFHSVLSFNFDSRLFERGWMDLLIIGDSGEGKSFAVRSFMDMVQLGDYASGESSKRTGLVYTVVEQADKKWYVKFGKYVQMDQQVLTIDESAELDGDELGKFTASRSDGVLRVNLAASAEARCRTRLIFISNPRSKRQISQFKFPIDCVNDVFNASADVRRLDLALILSKNDVDSKDMNVRAKLTAPIFSAELMRNSVLFAWTRTADDIVFTREAEDAILDFSIKLWDCYQHATIDLIPKGDTREKLARISAALASLVKSTDETGTKIIITPEIVEVVYGYIRTLYDSYGLRTASYFSRASSSEAIVTRAAGETRLELAMRKGKISHTQLYEILKTELNNDKVTIDHLLGIICRMDNFRIKDLSTTLVLDTRKLGSMFRTLMNAGFILYSSGAHSDTYTATSKLQSALRYMMNEEEGNKIVGHLPDKCLSETPIQ